MVRPTFIIAEPEADQALSARKLVIETAKFNVITAHSPKEFLELTKLFPNVDAVIMHTRLEDRRSQELVRSVRRLLPEKKLIAISPSRAEVSEVDYEVDSHDPQELVNLLRELFGDPRRLPAIQKE
jgi:response regulator RpfG family c-di-GMP phosphodiesterase